MSVEAATDGVTFATDLEQVLLPTLQGASLMPSW